MILNKTTIVLVRPQLPENIGMVARTMDNFGFKNLILVLPREKWPNKKSLQASKHAKRKQNRKPTPGDKETNNICPIIFLEIRRPTTFVQ